MVRLCQYPGCFNKAKCLRLHAPVSKEGGPLTFHKLPVNDPERLKLWLLAIRWDVNTPIEKLHGCRLCSEHFSADDYEPEKGKSKRLLKSSAVPGPALLFQPNEVNYIFHFTDKPAQSPTQSEENDLDISMLSLECPSDKDTSFVPTSSTSTSTPTSAEEREGEMWKERKWIVNESNLKELLKRCQECGAIITTTQEISSGSLIQVRWECEKRHQGHWKSCADVRGMALNNLLVAASVLFTGAIYTDIAEWAALINLQVPKKTTFYTMQSSYLIPVVDAAYTEKQAAIIDDLHIQNAHQKGLHLSGDGRSDIPGFSAKYNTYSLMDDDSDKIVHFELVQVTEASSSVAMEPIGLKRGLSKILEKGIKVDVLTTDRSPSIRNIMRVDYPFVQHEFDIWHVAKRWQLSHE
ncbi:hypothetical protein G5714_004622 [Onychostoma macrolepis]|uniref:THAP-type domain-containing protein n=1 Tax=Onychostoma macrolepis TaxID=369639 RepID=A0A7J6D555_9TELE|nr:hypothetical protein G5714_004622 [Onychostoma macrolepis]